MIVNREEFESFEDFARKGRGCDTEMPTVIEILRIDKTIADNNERRIYALERININIQFIHITNGVEGFVSEEQRIGQINVINNSFNKYGIFFTYKESDVKIVSNNSWFYMIKNSREEVEAKKSLQQDPSKNLNLYTAKLDRGVLGWATFPFNLSGSPSQDGVVVLFETLPGGNQEFFNLGMTAVHEIGHWLGLYHTFHGGCDGVGDYVNDTPAHSHPNYGTPEPGVRYYACRTDELDPVNNYMNYVNDEWMTEFTTAQIRRVFDNIYTYRPGLIQRSNLL